MLTRALFAPTLLLVLAGVGTGCSSTSAVTQPPSEAEYRAAVEAVADCLIGKGYDAEVDSGDLPGEYSVGINFSGNVEPEDAEAVAADAAYDECWAEHAKQTAQEFQEGQRLTGVERDKAMEALVECLTDLGVTGVDVGQTDSTVFVAAIWEQLAEGSREAVDAMDCMERHRGVWPPGDKNNP